MQVQKPLARDIAGSDRMLAATRESGATLSVLEDYLCSPPLVPLSEVVKAGGTSTYPADERQFAQGRGTRGAMLFDHGWHELAGAISVLGLIRRIFAWLGATEVVPGIVMDAPSTLMWEHQWGESGARDTFVAIGTGTPRPIRRHVDVIGTSLKSDPLRQGETLRVSSASIGLAVTNLGPCRVAPARARVANTSDGAVLEWSPDAQ